MDPISETETTFTKSIDQVTLIENVIERRKRKRNYLKCRQQTTH